MSCRVLRTSQHGESVVFLTVLERMKINTPLSDEESVDEELVN